MKRFVLCTLLLLVSISVSAGPLGLSAGLTGGAELWAWDVENAEAEALPAIGLTASFSPPFLPIGIRGNIEYAWKNVETPLGDLNLFDLFILLGLEYYIEPPIIPASLYIGAGLEISTIGGEFVEIEGLGTSTTGSGLLVYGGVNLSLGMLAVFGEIGYGKISVEHEVLNLNHKHVPLRAGIKGCI
jgi:hypothetical protein